MNILFISVNESSIISLKSIVGKEGGSLQFLGSQPDLLSLTFTSYHHLLEVFKDQLTFNVRLVRYGFTWWEGEAYVLDIASLGNVADSKTGLIYVTIGLQGIRKSISGPAIGMMGYAGNPQNISDDLIIIGSDWNYSLTFSEEFDQS